MQSNLGKGDKKWVKFDQKEVINEHNFGYNEKMKGYTNWSSDIPKLSDILISI